MIRKTPPAARSPRDPFAGRRSRMVEELRARGVRDERLLSVMGALPRHRFIESALSERAYDFATPPIGHGQTLSSPYTVALMTQMAELSGAETALEIGTGSGYQGAVLSKLVERLFTVERINALSNRARKIFNELGLANVVCIVGDGTVGVQSHAPFDVILVTASGPEIPKPLALQLAEGGRMVTPVKEPNGEE
ncbi:MAG: protein-L-isoaspartate(D-aspartate) O-methyltransferase, partial [Nitrospinae bacterium]|nr:protein-L-isoaspartate(D-aspartate) O-methyltransferase [Nitrospinota bacterium]